MNSTVRIDSTPSGSPSTVTTRDEKKSFARSSSEPTSELFRESVSDRSTEIGRRSEERTAAVLEAEIAYEEYEEEPSRPDRGRSSASKESSDGRRGGGFLSLLEEWRRLQTARATGAARPKRMERKTRKDSPKSQGRIGVAVGVDVGGGETEIRNRMIREMQDEIRMERDKEKRRAESEGEEAREREKQLEETRTMLSRHSTAIAENARILEREEKWARYMRCDGLPDPGSLPDMNAFLFLWTTESEEATMETAVEKCDVVAHLLSKLEEIVRFSASTSKEYAAECEAIGRRFREKLQRWIDLACYGLLRNIEARMNREDTRTTRYVRSSDKLVCCVWAPIPLPIGTKRLADKERKPVEVRFEEIELTIKLPVDTDCYRMAIRGLWLSYDHYSVETSSFRMPTLPQHLLDVWDPDSLDLLRFSRREHEEKVRIREDQAEERRSRLEETMAILEKKENPTVTAATAAAAPTSAEKRGKRGKKPKGPQSAVRAKQQELQSALSPETKLLRCSPTPSEVVRRAEEETRKDARRLLFTRCGKTEVNLRKYRILGGAYRVELVYQPPQPKDLGSETQLTTLELPKEPKFVPFRRPYEPPQPAPDSERTPEVIEAEIKALEAAMEELPLIALKLPDSVLWFEPPLLAHWIPDERIWSTNDVHDIKYNEEKQTIAFRSGRLGVFGLAAYKYANLPFQSWELKPETGRSGREYGGVVFTITAATVQAEFVVRNDRICLNSFAGGASSPLKPLLGRYTELDALIEGMQQVGCDLFPERDAVSYLKGLSTKHPIAEKHLRECMASLSTAYSFAWSRWNGTRDFREIVLQFKEVHGCVAKERTNLTLLVTPSRTMRVRCTEVSPEFSDLPLDDEDTQFYADLYQLALNTAGIKSRLLMERMSFKLLWTVARLLERTNVIGMSS